MRQDAEYFGDQAVELVYIAKKLSEAQTLEGLLTGAGVEYLVEADQYFGGFIFHRVRIGAFFYVRPEAAESARRLMEANGYRPHVPPAP